MRETKKNISSRDGKPIFPIYSRKAMLYIVTFGGDGRGGKRNYNCVIIWEWNEREGPLILAKYPKEIELSHKTMIHLYSEHLEKETTEVDSMLIDGVKLVNVWES